MAKTTLKTHCARFDHGGCGFKVTVEDGVIAKLEPNKDDPFSHGYSCRKGRSAVERLQHPDRLTHPLRRRGERGSGEWDEIGWDEALDLIASNFRKIQQQHGPEGLAFAQGAPKGPEFFVMLRLANLLNCPNVAGAQHVCHMPREQMAMATCGFFPVADLDNPTRCVVVWGSNPIATNEEGVLGGHLLECLKSQPDLIVVDPFCTELAKRAGIWLQIRPGTDDLLAMGWLHVILHEQLYDPSFVDRWTTGLEDLIQAVQPYTPEVVAQGTWLSRDELVQAARTYARSRPALIQWGNALEHTANSAQACRSLVLLMAVTGNLEKPGGNIRASAPKLKRLAEFIRLKEFPDRPNKLLNRHFGITPRLLTVPSWMMIRSILDQSPYPIRGLYTQGTNPMVTYAATGRVRQALAKLDFLAVADQVLTPTAALADLVLPVALPLEFNDIGHYGLPHGFVVARPKAVKPRGDCRPDGEILSDLGRRLGFAEDFWQSSDDMLAEILEPTGLTYEEFVERGMLKGPERYETYREKGFKTPSGKVELHSSVLQKMGFEPVPKAVAPVRLQEDFPLLLTSRKPRDFFHSGYRHLDRLRKRHSQPKLLIHPETAGHYGIEEGASVRISTAHGTIVQLAQFSDGLDPRVVYADFGWWFPEATADLFDCTRANLNVLTAMEGPTDPILGTTQMRALPCRVEPMA